MDGLLLWTVVHADAEAAVSYLDRQQAWLPVYFPLGPEPVAVRAGDELVLRWESGPGSDARHPDYAVEVAFADGTRRAHRSPHATMPAPPASTFHAALRQSVATSSGRLTVSELRAWLASRLPDYLVPQSWQFLPALPVTPTGKLDRSALPAVSGARPLLGGAAEAPADALEAAVAATWQHTLGLEVVGVTDDFFDLGGDSIGAVQLVTALQRRFNCALGLAALFDGPTVRALAAELRGRFPAEVAGALAREAAAGMEREQGEI